GGRGDRQGDPREHVPRRRGEGARLPAGGGGGGGVRENLDRVRGRWGYDRRPEADAAHGRPAGPGQGRRGGPYAGRAARGDERRRNEGGGHCDRDDPRGLQGPKGRGRAGGRRHPLGGPRPRRIGAPCVTCETYALPSSARASSASSTSRRSAGWASRS